MTEDSIKNFLRFIKNSFINILKILGIYKDMEYVKQKFPEINFDKQWYDHYLSTILVFSCKLEKIKLKNLKCKIKKKNGQWKRVSLYQSPMYQYLLSNDKQAYTEYHALVDKDSKEFVHNCENYKQLMEKLDNTGYDANTPICVKNDNEIIDGQHRASYLLKKYGEDYEITVFKLYY